MSPQQSAARFRRSKYFRPAAVIAIAILAALAVVGVIGLLTPTRHAPASANYSRDADPYFYADVKNVADTNPDARGALTALTQQPVAEWLPTNAADAGKTITQALAKSRADKTIPVFVTYAIPNRDNGGQSAGGLNADGYRAYLRAISSVIADAPAIVVVEPDALAHMPDLSDSQQTVRAGLLADALDTFYDNKSTAVYLDAGNSAWRSADQTAGLLKRVDAAAKHGVPGISLNVSNFQPDSTTRAYGEEISKAYGHDLFIMIDSSRNGGNTAASDWCNPSGQKLGTADARFDAGAKIEQAYIKTPGESDGQCGISSKPAGEFDPSLLLAQVGTATAL